MSTATEAAQVPVIKTFRERIENLNRKDLVEIAKDEFQLNVDSKVKDDILRDLLIRTHEERAFGALEKNQAAASLFLERDRNDKLLTVQFLNLEFANNPEKFSWDGGYGITDRKNPSRNKKGLSKMANFFLIPGEVYQLPITVIKHLESKVFYDAVPVIDTETGMQAGSKPVLKQRFMCRPILDEAAMSKMGSRDFKKG